MDQPFFEIYVKNVVRGGTTVYWGLQRWFNDVGPYRFRLQWAETKHGQWEDVPTAPLIDVYWAEDPNQRMWAKELESYYRVILTTADGEYVSFPQQASGTWNKREWLIARDICRKEWLRLEKQVGVRGYLLKRKIWGERCTACTDWDNPTDPSDSSCTVCWGTGIVGGYFPAIATYIDSNLIPREKEIADNAGMRENLTTQARMFGYPHVATYDIFIDAKTDRRWIVRKVDNVAELRGQPLIYNAEIRLAPFTDPVYDIPLNPTPSSVSSVSSASSTTSSSSSSSSACPTSSSSSQLSSSSSSSSSSSQSSSSSSSSLYPNEPPFFEEGWDKYLWYDDATRSWVLGSPDPDFEVFYISEMDSEKAWPYIPTFEWHAVGAQTPVPVFEYVAGGSFVVTNAGTVSVNGLYTPTGTWNDTYVYQRSSSSSSSVPSSSSSSSSQGQ
jgi:hypothetical protein